MRVGTEEESLESRPFSRFPLLYVAPAQIVAGVNLVVAQLEVLVLAVVFPPVTVETGSVVEMTTKRIEIYRNVWDGTACKPGRRADWSLRSSARGDYRLPSLPFLSFLFFLSQSLPFLYEGASPSAGVPLPKAEG